MKEDNISDIEEISTHSRNDPKEVPAPKEENNYNPNRMRSCLQNKQSCLEFIESTPATAFMAVVTIYALYSDDIQVLGFDKSADNVFMIMSSTAFFLFVLEICIQCWCRENYLKRPSISALFCRGHNLKSKWKSFCSLFNFGSFYFWLDLLATLTMMFEIPWMTFATADGIDNNFENARAGKASRAGAKAARFLRVVRMIRLIRLVKLYKYFVSKNKFKKEGSASIFPDHEDEKALLNMPPESHVGAEMSDRTTKKVIIGILIMLIVIPLLQVEKLEYINEYGMHLVLQQRARVNKTYQDIINWEFSESLFLNNTDCISLMYSGFEDGIREFGIIPGGRANPETLRSKEKSIISIFSPENGNSSLMAVF
jgi:Ion transport protein.